MVELRLIFRMKLPFTPVGFAREMAPMKDVREAFAKGAAT